MLWKKMFLTLLFGIPLLSLMGCGGSSDMPDLGTVTGTVTMDDKPLANVIVVFYPEGNAKFSLAGTDEKGYYELAYNETAKGAAIGQHTIRISTPTDAPPSPGKELKDIIPARYNKKSKLEREVKAGENRFDFDLKSK